MLAYQWIKFHSTVDSEKCKNSTPYKEGLKTKKTASRRNFKICQEKGATRLIWNYRRERSLLEYLPKDKHNRRL